MRDALNQQPSVPFTAPCTNRVLTPPMEPALNVPFTRSGADALMATADGRGLFLQALQIHRHVVDSELTVIPV